MRNQFHYYILFLCAAAFHASVPILRVFRLAILGAKASSTMAICNTFRVSHIDGNKQNNRLDNLELVKLQ